MPIKDKDESRVYMREYMQGYRERQTDEENLKTLRLLELIQETERNENELAKMKADPAYVCPVEKVAVGFQPLPKELLHLLEPRYPHNEVFKSILHSKLSHYYYEMSRAQRSEAALRATMDIQERRARELSKDSKAAQLALTMLQFKKGLGYGSEKAETFEARLERFQWCARQLKEQGFNWYVTSEVCGHAYLLANDFASSEELMQRGGHDERFGRYYYLPSNKHWSLGGNFKKRPFVEAAGDLDWMWEWALSEREECISAEEKDRQWVKNNYDKANAAEKVQRNAEDLFKTEKLSEEKVVERLKLGKNPLLDDTELEAFVRITKSRVEAEEKARIFQDEKVEPILTEPVTESKVAFTNFKVKVEAKVKDEDEVT